MVKLETYIKLTAISRDSSQGFKKYEVVLRTRFASCVVEAITSIEVSGNAERLPSWDSLSFVGNYKAGWDL